MSVLSLCFLGKKNSWSSKLFSDPICPFSTCWFIYSRLVFCKRVSGIKRFYFVIISSQIERRYKYINGIEHRVHRVAMATFWHTFHHDGKISPAKWGGRHTLPLSLYLPSRAKLWCTLQLRGQMHSPYFSSTLICTLWYWTYCNLLSLLQHSSPGA